MIAPARPRKHWGWGYADEEPSPVQRAQAAAFLAAQLGFGSSEPAAPVALADVRLPAPRLRPPRHLADICLTDAGARARHALGSSYRDVVLGWRGEFAHPPDLVARPGDEAQLAAVLEWALDRGAAVIPYGGGTSVVGGVEPRVDPDRFTGVVTIDLGRSDRLRAVDAEAGLAWIEAGATGPQLEAALRPHGLTLRHFPQSFAFATLGGMIATRAGGHFATGPTHIDELVAAVHALTPVGPWESRRLPGSGAGPSPDRMLLGSEGALGIITSAWVRVRERPGRRAGITVRFAEFEAGARAVRAIARSGLAPANLRLIDAAEARMTGAGDAGAAGARDAGAARARDAGDALLVIAFESARRPVQAELAAALELCAEHGGRFEPPGADATTGADARTGGPRRDASAEGWREAFLRAPYLRDTLVAMGVLCETFETAIDWGRFEAFHATVGRAARAAVAEVCGAGSVTCRLTHAYPDGAAPYFTVLAPARPGEELAQWAAIKRAASEAILAGGGTITHHHAVGRDHRPWYDRQRPDPFATALRAAKAALDPAGALNPGVLIDA
jgi:alkyldihydroxyacetonephosphate synthase